jgi:hypothetical protein
MDGSQPSSSRATSSDSKDAAVSNDLWTSDSVAPQWHPKVAQFFLYWRRIHPAGGLPGRQHFDPLAIHALLPGVWLLDFEREPFRLRYRLIGTEAVEAVGAEVTGQWMDEAHPVIGQTPGYLDRYRAVVEQKVPSWRRGTPRLWTHKKYATLENILVPLASDGSTVDMLAALTVFHAAPPGESDTRPPMTSLRGF